MPKEETKYSTFDESEFPIVKVTFNLKHPNLNQFMQFIDAQKRILNKKEKFVLLMNARNVSFLSSDFRIE